MLTSLATCSDEDNQQDEDHENHHDTGEQHIPLFVGSRGWGDGGLLRLGDGMFDLGFDLRDGRAIRARWMAHER